MIQRPSWDESFMLHAILSATRGSCLVRRVGAVLVRDKRIIASGYNGAAPNVETCLDTQVCFYQDLAYQDSLKGQGDFKVLKEERKQFCPAVHAEQNAVNQCSRMGVRAEGSHLYTTNFPCPGCVRNAIISNGITGITVWKDYLQNPLLTMDEYGVSKSWLAQAGISVKKMELSKLRIEEIVTLALSVGDRLEYQFVPELEITTRS